MKVVPADIEAVFEVSYPGETSLDVAMRVFDVTDVNLISQVSLVAMEHAFFGSYVAAFVPDPGKRYLIQKGVYTDNTFSFPNTDYGTASETIYGDPSSLTELESKVDQLLAQGAGQIIVGTIESNEVIGFIECE